MSLLPVEPAWRLAERAQEHRWLVTGLWAEQAVGIVGGEPKCCKSFLSHQGQRHCSPPSNESGAGHAREPRPSGR